jgi:alpha-1,6-mannosyltransferase
MWSAVEFVTRRAPDSFPWRLGLLGIISGVLYVVGNLWQPPLQRTNHPAYFLWFTAVFLVYVIALLEVWRRPPRPHPYLMPLILGWAVMFRLSLLWVTPGFLSDDIYRYAWDGLVQQAGINPYRYPPEAPELGFLRDETIFPMINRKWALTIYPPVAQLFFRALAWLWPGQVVAMKSVILLADMGSIALLLHLLKELHLPPSRIVLYAWHPLVIVELGISGHLDGLMLPFVLLALVGMMHHRSGLGGIALAIATLIKLYPAILLAALYRKGNWRMPLAFFGMVGLGYLLYLDAGAHILGYLPYYIAPDEFHNLSLRPILMWLVGLVIENPFPLVKWLSVTILGLVMVYCARQSPKSPQQAVHWGVGLIALYLLLVSPSVFQWYLVWLLGFVTLTQSWLTPAWLYWSWAVNLDYLETVPLFSDALYRLHLVEYVPVLAWIIGYWWVARSGTPRSAPDKVADAAR